MADQMLQHAAGTDAEMRTPRLDPVGRGLEHFLRACLVEMAVACGLLDLYTLTNQGAGDEHGLAVETADPASFMAEVIDVKLELAFCFRSASCHNGLPY